MEVSKISKVKDLTGQKFEKLLVISQEPSKNGRAMWLCLCDCGKYITVMGKLLINGHTKSCGCLKYSLKGLSDSRLYRIWRGIKSRCYNEHHDAYYRYGGRGIIVCDDWKNSFQSFYNWAIANKYDSNLTIDRIDNNKGYSPNNCRWVDKTTQQRNRRGNLYYTINGVTKCLKEWCQVHNLNYATVHKRVSKYNWSIGEALELKERTTKI